MRDARTLSALGANVARHNVWGGAGTKKFNKHKSSASAAKRAAMRAVLLNATGVRAEIAAMRRRLGYPPGEE